MCRLLYLPPSAPRKRSLLKAIFDQLEKSFGGDGNGFATMRGGIVKGVGLSTSKCAKLVSRCRGNVIWHTRRRSCGPKTAELCHPFRTGNGYLAHNGHSGKFMVAAWMLKGTWSDSKVAAYFCRLYGWNKLCQETDGGVWLHLTSRGCYVCYDSGSLVVEAQTGALSSEPLGAWGDWRPAEHGCYLASSACAERRPIIVTDGDEEVEANGESRVATPPWGPGEADQWRAKLIRGY